jgi:hypothetical protein
MVKFNVYLIYLGQDWFKIKNYSLEVEYQQLKWG